MNKLIKNLTVAAAISICYNRRLHTSNSKRQRRKLAEGFSWMVV